MIVLRPYAALSVASLAFIPAFIAACGSSGGSSGGQGRQPGQSSYQSAPLPDSANLSFGGGAEDTNAGAAAPTSSSGSSSGGASSSTSGATSNPEPTVQETDIYRVSGNTLYYLDSYRGLMIFDITNVDQPKLVGRSPIFGDPQEMYVDGNLAVVVVGDWYGVNPDGSPFYGSLAQGLDCTDPTNIKDVGDVYLRGYVQDTRIVGNVLYTVAQDYGWEYGWEYGWGGYYGGGIATPVSGGVGLGSANPQQSSVVLASVSFANGTVTKVSEQAVNGYNGIINVTPTSIMLATTPPSSDPNDPYGEATTTTLQYVDITNSNGTIVPRGTISINGVLNGWGPDNGRWNLDFADGVHAHGIGCTTQYCGSDQDTYVLSTVDFTNPDAPTLSSALPIANLGWSAAARFDVDPGDSWARLYLSPSDDDGTSSSTPFSIYDLTKPAAPVLAGTTTLDGDIWLFMPEGDHVFALGNTDATNSSLVEVQYVDVTNPAAPVPMGASQFGNGWAWSPAEDTFKAFIVNSDAGLAVVPFSGWDSNSQQYTNGVQLVQFTSQGITGSGTARTTGWVERGIFVGSRLYSLSDQAMAVVDYSNPTAPNVITEMTLARNVVAAQPQGSTIAELSSDWWGNDVTSSEMRVLPIGNAAETTDEGPTPTATINGVDAQTFQNGTLSYVVTDVQVPVPCSGDYGYGPSGPSGGCTGGTQQVTVVDTSNGGAVVRGTVQLPTVPYFDGDFWGWDGFWYYDWYDGADVVQVGTDALAFRRWYPQYATDPSTGYPIYEDSLDALYVVDLSNPDAPGIASLTVTDDPTAWWGNMMAINDTLYTTHYEWVNKPDPNSPSGTVYWTRYYLDQVDLSDRAHPRIGQSINVPGTLVGASSQDPTMLYFADYNWNGQNENDGIAVCQVNGGKCYLQSYTQLDGYVGNVIVQNDEAYMTVQQYDWAWEAGGAQGQPYVELHQLDLSNPQSPVDRISTNPDNGWGWLLAVEGDRAVVTSGWGPVAVDIYQLSDTAAPAYEETVRTLGWGGANSITRQNNTLYLASGYWGVQPIQLP